MRELPQQEFRPIHETILKTIASSYPGGDEIFYQLRLIQETKFDGGFDEIIAAVKKKYGGPNEYRDEVEKAVKSLLAQKEAMINRKESVDLRTLGDEARNLHALLTRDVLGNFKTWKLLGQFSKSLKERMERVHGLLSHALGK